MILQFLYWYHLQVYVGNTSRFNTWSGEHLGILRTYNRDKMYWKGNCIMRAKTNQFEIIYWVLPLKSIWDYKHTDGMGGSVATQSALQVPTLPGHFTKQSTIPWRYAVTSGTQSMPVKSTLPIKDRDLSFSPTRDLPLANAAICKSATSAMSKNLVKLDIFAWIECCWFGVCLNEVLFLLFLSLVFAKIELQNLGGLWILIWQQQVVETSFQGVVSQVYFLILESIILHAPSTWQW